MTDNRTTEKLRKLLEERGIKWRETINHANCIFTWWESPTFGIVHAMDNEDGETLFMACLNSCFFTPEQAIAATLGNDQELIDLAYNAWAMALYAMQGMPIPADWSNSVEQGLRKYGINVD